MNSNQRIFAILSIAREASNKIFIAPMEVYIYKKVPINYRLPAIIPRRLKVSMLFYT